MKFLPQSESLPISVRILNTNTGLSQQSKMSAVEQPYLNTLCPPHYSTVLALPAVISEESIFETILIKKDRLLIKACVSNLKTKRRCRIETVLGFFYDHSDFFCDFGPSLIILIGIVSLLAKLLESRKKSLTGFLQIKCWKKIS